MSLKPTSRARTDGLRAVAGPPPHGGCDRDNLDAALASRRSEKWRSNDRLATIEPGGGPERTVTFARSSVTPVEA